MVLDHRSYGTIHWHDFGIDRFQAKPLTPKDFPPEWEVAHLGPVEAADSHSYVGQAHPLDISNEEQYTVPPRPEDDPDSNDYRTGNGQHIDFNGRIHWTEFPSDRKLRVEMRDAVRAAEQADRAALRHETYQCRETQRPSTADHAGPDIRRKSARLEDLNGKSRRPEDVRRHEEPRKLRNHSQHDGRVRRGGPAGRRCQDGQGGRPQGRLVDRRAVEIRQGCDLRHSASRVGRYCGRHNKDGHGVRRLRSSGIHPDDDKREEDTRLHR